MLLFWMQVIVAAALANPQIPPNTFREHQNTTGVMEHLISNGCSDKIGECIEFGNLTMNSSVSAPGGDTGNYTDTTIETTLTSAIPAWKVTFYKFRFFMNGIYIPTVAVLGIIGNSITLSVLRKDVLQSSSTIYLLGMAVADLLFTINFSPVALNAYDVIRTSRIMKSINAIRFSYFSPLISINSTASAWITIFFSIERFFVVKWPLKAKEFCTKRRARIVVIGVYVYSIALHLIRFFFRYPVRKVDPVTQEVYFTYTYTDLGRNQTAGAVTFWVYFLLVTTFPFVFLACLNSAIIWYVWRAQRRRLMMAGNNDTSENKGSSRESQITRLLMSLVIAYLICNTCSGLNSIWVAMNGRSALQTTQDPYLYYILTLGSSFAMTNPLVNCILYCVCSSTMREGIKSQLCLGRNLSDKRDPNV